MYKIIITKETPVGREENKNSIQFFIICVPTQQLQDQSNKQHSIDAINYITYEQKQRQLPQGPFIKQHSGKTTISVLHNEEKHKDTKTKKNNTIKQ
jgi:hypothetical protein